MIRRLQSEPAKTSPLDTLLSWIAPERALRRAAARRMLELSMFKGASTDRLRNNWVLPGDADGANPSRWELSTLRSRARDANRNDPVAAGASETLRTNIVGQGLRPQSKLRADALGVSEERAGELRRMAEAAWARFVPLADAANRLDFDELQFLAISKIIEDGETIALPTWAAEPWRPYGRCLQILESERLCSPSDAGAGKAVDGIEDGDRGEPLRYWLRKAGARGHARTEFDVLAARDDRGRPKVLHVFATRRPGQRRGIPWFAPVLTYFKDLADYLEAEIVAARVAACLAVFVTKNDPLNAANYMSGNSETGTGARVQGIEPGLVSYLSPGEGISVVDPRRPGDSFGAFVETSLRLIGVGLGLPYELLVKDFSKTNYSSARAAILEGRRQFTNWRAWFARKFCQPVWDLVLEEAYLRGDFPVADFYRNRAEYARALWVGGAWGWVDPVKEVESSKKAIDYGLSTLAEEAAGQGRDWEEVLEQKAREQQRAGELGLDLSAAPKTPAGPGPAEETNDEA